MLQVTVASLPLLSLGNEKFGRVWTVLFKAGRMNYREKKAAIQYNRFLDYKENNILLVTVHWTMFKRVGINKGTIRYKTMQLLVKGLPKYHFKNVSDQKPV